MNPTKIIHGDRTEYKVNNKLHREDGPAVVFKNGDICYYYQGELHRDDGPAIKRESYRLSTGGHVTKDRVKLFYNHGMLHREDGPAVMYANGDKCYYYKGKRHREDGPAIIRKNGDIAYYVNGRELTKEQFDMIQYIKHITL